MYIGLGARADEAFWRQLVNLIKLSTAEYRDQQILSDFLKFRCRMVQSEIIYWL